MNEKNNFALVPRRSGALEKAEPGAKHILSGMVADALALARRESGVQLDFVSESSESANDLYRRGLECEERGDHSQAFQFYKQAAEKGDSWAQYKVGCSYLRGDVVPQDYIEAAKWIRKSAENEEQLAQVLLGLLCLLGRGAPLNIIESVKWFSKATSMEKVEEDALLDLFNNQVKLPQNISEFIKCLRDSAERENTGAQWLLADCYYFGWFVPENDTEAAKWYKNFAERGLAEAQCQLAFCYCDSNKSEHVKWLRKAAEQGHEKAQIRLSIILGMGGYLPEEQQDIVEAYKWAMIRAEGNRENLTSNIRDFMTPEQIEKGEALAREYLLKTTRQQIN